jgi:alcohol dehydrogenase
VTAWRFANPVHLVFGDDLRELVSPALKGRAGSSVLLISYDWFRETEACHGLEVRCEGIRGFFDIEENPSFESCQRAVDFAFTNPPEAIVAVGGGSVIDTAKAVREALARDHRRIPTLFQASAATRPRPFLIAVPTTHGTGSEVTPWATIWDKANKVKRSLSDPRGFPDVAVYCPALMERMPVSVALTSTLDALSHAFEAIWNKKHNPVSTHLALKAIVQIVSHLKDVREIMAPEARRSLIEASMFAGLAFSNTQTAAAHAISYPLTTTFGIPHGLACSLPLYPLLKINERAIGPELRDLFERLHVSSVDELWGRIRDGIAGRLPLTLSESGVGEGHLDWLADTALVQSRMDNNIIDLGREDVRQALRSIL